MKPTINDLIKLGIIQETTTKLQEKHKTRQFIVNNPYKPEKSSIYYLHNNEDVDLSNRYVKSKYIVRKRSKCSPHYYCPWSWSSSHEGNMIVKEFNSLDEMMDYATKKFIHYYFTQSIDGYTDTNHLLSKQRMKKMDKLTIEDLKSLMSIFSLRDPNLSREVYLKTMD